MSKQQGIVIDEVMFFNKHGEGEFRLYGQVEQDVVYITSTDSASSVQHDFTLKKSDWELFRNVIDTQLEQGRKKHE